MPSRLFVLSLFKSDFLELLRKTREYRLEPTHQALEEIDPPAEGEINVGLHRVLVCKVDDADLE